MDLDVTGSRCLGKLLKTLQASLLLRILNLFSTFHQKVYNTTAKTFTLSFYMDKRVATSSHPLMKNSNANYKTMIFEPFEILRKI